MIVEDEHLAADVISDYIRQIPGLKLCGICETVFSAMEKLRNEKIDIIFLDINLPKVNGIEFIKTINGRYDIILTTAYHDYAIEGFNLGVTDYLLKPIEFTRFLKAVNKVFDKRREIPGSGQEGSAERKFYFFNADKKQVKVYADEILYIESLKDYVRIHTKDRKVVTKFQIGEMEKMLSADNFTRIHKSFIVNRDKISAYNAREVELGTISLPVGRIYKEMVEKQVGGRK
ncbi:MAG: LytTR family DNA-binding domain-containing protein [Bacteroidia bacterium]